MADKPTLPAVAGRYLVGGLCALAIIVGLAPEQAAAATVDCGRVTTFVAPNSAGALSGGDGWVIFAKPDGTSAKVILRSGTQTPTGAISGYICVGIDGVYFTGLIAPGTAGYVPEPADFVTGTGVYCGTVAANPFTSGQVSGPRTFQLGGGLSAFGGGIFSVPTSIDLPAIGSYLCGRFSVGAPSQLVALLQAGDPGYVARGLPNTSTAAHATPTAGLAGLLLVTGLALLALSARKWRPDRKPMTRTLVPILLAAVMGCSPSTAPPPPASGTVAIATTSPTAPLATTLTAATPIPLATSTPTVWALVCGTVSDLVTTTTTTNGSLVLNSPGRTPLTVTLTPAHWNPEARAAFYICARLDAGGPRPVFAGIAVPSSPDAYVESNSYPATKAMPSPTGFVVPQACAYVRPPEVGTDQTYWWVDCGAELNPDARGTLGAALTQQGWTGCGPAAATEMFFKGTMRIVVVESSLAAGDYPRFSQRLGTGCT